ncbi:MAG: C2H2-type zinc finger protein, partial [Thermoproteota archaeon]
SIKEFLDSIGESRNFAVISRGNTISITSISGKPIERTPKPTGQMFSCAHCGHVTPYEVVHNLHMRIHYL